MGRPRVLLVPPPLHADRYHSVDRVNSLTSAALRSQFDVTELRAPIHGDEPALRAEILSLRHRIDVVFDLTAFASTGPLAPEIPLLFWALGNLPHGATIFSTRRRYLKTSDTVLLNCRADQRILDHTLGTSGPHAALVPFGVDTGRFKPLPSEAARSQVRRRMGLPEEAVLWVYAGRINFQKNVHLLLSLLARSRRYANVHLAIAGAPESTRLKGFGLTNEGYPESLPGLADHLAVTQRVHFLGSLADTDLAELYGAADIFLSLSTHHDENFGYAAAEALCAGLPVVLSDWGGYQDHLEYAGSGSLKIPTVLGRRGPRVAFTSRDDSLRELCVNADRRRALAALGRDQTVARLSIEAFTKNLAAVVSETAKRRDTGARFGDLSFAFHPLARKLHAHNALKLLSFDRGEKRVDHRWSDQNYDTYRFFLGPYASSDVCDLQLEGEDRLSPTIELSVVGNTLNSLDRAWTGAWTLPEGHARALAGTVVRPQTVTTLASQNKLPVGELLASATLLAREGVLFRESEKSTEKPME